MPGHELAIALRIAYLSLHRRTDAIFAKSGVTADQFVVLAALSQEDAVTQRELAARTSCDPNTLRQMLVLLEGQELIERRPHTTDNRARTVCLTPRGKRTFRSLWRKSEPLRSRLVESFEPRELERFIDQLQSIVQSMQPDSSSEQTPRPSRLIQAKHRQRTPSTMK